MSIKVKSNLSKRLIGRGNVSEYGNKLKELSMVAGTLAPEGALYVSLVDKSEMYLPSTKVVRDLMDLDFLYNTKALQTNPALAQEFGEIATHMKAIEAIISKRRKKLYKRRKENEQRHEETEKQEESNE